MADSSATLTAVAEQAGVSRSTASRVFSQPHRLSAETVRRVRAVAAALGYEPRSRERALSGVRSQRLALLVADLSNPFFPPMIRAVEERAAAAGYSVLVGDTDEDAKREEALLSRFGPDVDGFVMASSRMPAEAILAQARKRAVVLVNRDLADVPRVLIDTTSGVTQAVDHLARLGHTRITYLSGPTRSWSNTQRREAVRRAGELRGLSVLITSGRRSSYDAGRAAVGQLLASGSTAVIAFDDLLAHGILAGLADRGVAVPAEFSVIGCDDVLPPYLTTVSRAAAAAVAAALALLLSHLTTPLPKHHHRHTLPTTLIPRTTTSRAHHN
ncbi:LacI family DNA-binding transcriptional regulator [Kribbella sandramycini]|uniref:LacI family DNA-binding transcriptional regulator n=1 Tax=Kribbella sandramycini TaxID=60450 RepID=UPI0031DDAA44